MNVNQCWDWKDWDQDEDQEVGIVERDKLGIDKIGWELGWIPTKEEVRIVIQ